MKIIYSKTIFHILNILFLLLTVTSEAQKQKVIDKMDWWKDAKFGMFMHWGLYSKTAGYWNGHKAKGFEHFMIREKISLKEYAKIADDFNPVNYNAEKWVLTAKKAGMKYIVITSKHHDGFAMFDSPSNDYNIKTRTPYGKDPMKELVAACRKHNIKFGFYYSLGRDWQDPDVPTNWPSKGANSNTVDYPDEDAKVFNKYFERKVKPQVKELLTQYGNIDIMWFDTPMSISIEESEELKSLINSIQPNCIINSRIGNRLGDYRVTERKIINRISKAPWEACTTMGRNWGYIKYDTVYKSPELMVRQLLEIISKGGNLLLNNGPTSKGEITHFAQERLAQIGEWMKINSEGIYGSRPWKIPGELLSDSFKLINSEKQNKNNSMKDAVNDATSKIIMPEARFSVKGNNLYVYVCNFLDKQVLIKSLANKKNNTIKKITILGSLEKVHWSQTSEGLRIEIPLYPLKEIPIMGFKIMFQ